MNPLIFSLLLGAFFPGAAAVGTASIMPPPIRKVSPAELKQFIDSSDHPIIVEFWATVCTPCLVEIPYLQTTAARYKEQGVELILVSLDNPSSFPDGIAVSADKRGFTAATHFWLSDRRVEPGRAAIDPRYTSGIPCILFVNNHTHYHQFYDRQLTDRQVEPEIRKML